MTLGHTIHKPLDYTEEEEKKQDLPLFYVEHAKIIAKNGIIISLTKCD